MYNHTKKITISNIKDALTKLYRPEQISRLGNNFVIYRSFNTLIYNELINLELNKIIIKLKDKFDINLIFKKNVKDLIFREGVFASQGVRPVFSTITSLIETKIGKIIIDILKEDIDAKNIIWNYQDDKFILNIDDKKIFEYEINLKVDNLRKSKNDDTQALIGIHEAGHVITSVYEMNLCPKIAVSKTLRNGGFTYTEIPELDSKKLLLQHIKVLLGGYVAERLIFADENLTSGSNDDLRKVTEIALRMVKQYGMNNSPLQFSSMDFRISNKSLDDHGLDNIAKEIVNNCLKETEKILKENIDLLLKIGNYLTSHSRIETKKIKSMVKKYGKSPVPKYKTKDNFYDYKKIIKDKIKISKKWF